MERALLVSEALKHPRIAALPFIAAEAGAAAIKGGEDMTGFVVGSAALTMMMSGLFRRAWWNYAYIAGAAGYIADQPLIPIVSGVAIVADLVGHVGHLQTGIGEKDDGGDIH